MQDDLCPREAQARELRVFSQPWLHRDSMFHEEKIKHMEESRRCVRLKYVSNNYFFFRAQKVSHASHQVTDPDVHISDIEY